MALTTIKLRGSSDHFLEKGVLLYNVSCLYYSSLSAALSLRTSNNEESSAYRQPSY